MEEADKGWLMTTIGVSGWMFLLVPAHPGCPGQNPESHKMVVCVCVYQYKVSMMIFMERKIIGSCEQKRHRECMCLGKAPNLHSSLHRLYIYDWRLTLQWWCYWSLLSILPVSCSSMPSSLSAPDCWLLALWLVLPGLSETDKSVVRQHNLWQHAWWQWMRNTGTIRFMLIFVECTCFGTKITIVNKSMHVIRISSQLL